MADAVQADAVVPDKFKSTTAAKAGAHKYQWEQGLLLIFLTNQLV